MRYYSGSRAPGFCSRPIQFSSESVVVVWGVSPSSEIWDTMCWWLDSSVWFFTPSRANVLVAKGVPISRSNLPIEKTQQGHCFSIEGLGVRGPDLRAVGFEVGGKAVAGKKQKLNFGFTFHALWGAASRALSTHKVLVFPETGFPPKRAKIKTGLSSDDHVQISYASCVRTHTFPKKCERAPTTHTPTIFTIDSHASS